MEFNYKNNFKRKIDIFFSIILLIILFPLFILVGLALFIFDNGPVLYGQNRVGENLKIFRILKFRSMPVETQVISSDKLKEIKISKIGFLLRRSNIDELPQLINILYGDMTFVGPRPCLESQYELIDLRKLNKSILCTPGLTGLAQINSYNNMTYAEKSYYDGLYAKNICLKTDLLIVIKTIRYLLKKPPVY
jgi:O-antigen biosynthesis protein WbqP